MSTAAIHTIVKKNLEEQIKGNKLTPYNLAGIRGIGKTARIKEIVEELDSNLLHISIPAKTLEYYQGLPVFVDMPSAAAYSRSGNTNTQGTQWTMPEIINQANRIAETHGSCVLFLDDFHKIDETISAVMYELLWERAIGDYKLHDNIAIIIAMNDSKTNNFTGMEAAIKDRMSILVVEFDFTFWYKNYGRFLHPFISSFLSTNSPFVIETETNMIEQSASARAWSELSKEFDLHDEKFVKKYVNLMALTKMSKTAASALSIHISHYMKLDFKRLIKTKNSINLDNINEQDKLLYGNLIHYIDTPEDAAYMVYLINTATNTEGFTNFVGFIVGVITTKYELYEKNNSDKKITTAHKILFDKVLGQYKESNYKLTKKQKELLSIDFIDRDKLMEIAANYII